VSYATGDSTSKHALNDTFVNAFAGLAHANQSQVAAQVTATLKVIDEQRAKSSRSLASDDRAAATSMQPIADSIR